MKIRVWITMVVVFIVWSGGVGQGELAQVVADASTADSDQFGRSTVTAMLGRPTDESITLSIIPWVGIDAYVEYDTVDGRYDLSTSRFDRLPPSEPTELVIGNLRADKRYYYRVRYRRTGDPAFKIGPSCWFHTQRQKTSDFVFDVEADSHLYLLNGGYLGGNDGLFSNTLGNIVLDRPDFLIDLGDFIDGRRSIWCYQNAFARYLTKRSQVDAICRSIPFFLVLGNHESEQGWRVTEGDSVAQWCTVARKALIPNPCPDRFYSGNQDSTVCCGLREDYYAWEWGDALFVVLDPFWYTPSGECTDAPCNGWDWTLGQKQYVWFRNTLHNSVSRWKFVFCHHMTGGVRDWTEGPRYYGRGGVEAAKYKVDGRPSFEWGGEDEHGDQVFEHKRPGWSYGPIHDVMVREGVDIFFHGHDHVFVHQTLDGVVYQECPRPNDLVYGDGLLTIAGYTEGVHLKNSGHLRVEVFPDSVRVDYVRSVLPQDEPLLELGKEIRNRDVSYSYVIRK